jgi:Holliday junction resolvasome RuvABC endonuclease subunit
MIILALDLGTTTGWAIKSPAGIHSGSQCFQSKRHEGAGMRYLRFKRWLTEIKQSGITEVYFEEVRRHVSTDSAHVYGGFMAVLTAWCEQHEIPYSSVAVGTIKKSWTGKGNAKKMEMIDEARLRGFDPIDDNESDALALMHCVCK